MSDEGFDGWFAGLTVEQIREQAKQLREATKVLLAFSQASARLSEVDLDVVTKALAGIISGEIAGRRYAPCESRSLRRSLRRRKDMEADE